MRKMKIVTCNSMAENILNERSQTQKITYCLILFTQMTQMDKSKETKSSLVVAQGQRVEVEEILSDR